MKFQSIRFKISVFFTAVIGIILLLYTSVIYYNLRYALYRDLDSKLSIKAQEIANAINSFLPVLENDQRAFRFAADMVIRQQGTSPNQEMITEAAKRWLSIRDKLDISNDYIVLSSADAKVISNSQNVGAQVLPYLVKGVPVPLQKTVSYRNIKTGTLQLRLITIPYFYRNNRMYLITVGSSLAPVNQLMQDRMLYNFFAILLILVFAGSLGGVLTDRILKPVIELTDIARNITYKDLSVRVKAQEVDEELKYLVNAFNEMISRLDKSFRYISEFSSNVAHELKTPLTVIRGESEVALMQERDAIEYQRVIKVSLEETELLLKIVEDLLLLSRIEYEPRALNFERLDFNSFIEEVSEQAKKMAGPKNISVKLSLFTKPVFINADRLHLRRMFLNLINNAVKFTHPGGKITIKVQAEARKLKVSVSDTGIGIKPEDLDKIFDRFFHLAAEIRGSESGSGLGLSIVQSIVNIHHADISVQSQPQKGTTFTVTFPI